MVELLRRILTKKPQGIPPVLVRLRRASPSDAGPAYAEGQVEVEALWGSGPAAQRWNTRASQGLCIIPWQRGRSVKLRFRHQDASAEIELTHEHARAGSAAELWLA